MKKRMWNMLWQVPIPKSNMYAISDKLSPEDASDDYEGRMGPDQHVAFYFALVDSLDTRDEVMKPKGKNKISLLAGQPCSCSHGGAAVTQRRGNRWTLPAASSSRHLGGDNPVVETGDGKRSLMGKKNTSKYTGGGMVVGVFAP
ncbi:hypothetical protein Tco_0938143 [Tanacetum coccineum]|uniref:Uncharacterized protein n=1 Tax=Tanacetum coccineum TaxID=301880 RepID=A0ABQ5DJ16_9ASTR